MARGRLVQDVSEGELGMLVFSAIGLSLVEEAGSDWSGLSERAVKGNSREQLTEDASHALWKADVSRRTSDIGIKENQTYQGASLARRWPGRGL